MLMPFGEGYWLNAYTGDLVRVYEHFQEVQAHPRKFGLTRAAVVGDREAVLRKVLRNGWIRVRSGGGETVCEFECSRSDAMFTIQHAAKRFEIFGEYSTVRINDLRNNASVVVRGSEIIDAEDPADVLGVSMVAGKKPSRKQAIQERV
jgi:hypothetical protein